MSALPGQVAEWVNPIIIKEVRQGLRTRVFWVFFTLMLVACVFISLGFFAAASDGSDTLGQVAFLSFFACLGAVQFFVIPYSAYRSMARETEEETWVLLTLTGLGPRKILGGKLGSTIMQGTLYLSAAAPFLLFSYYLNGIDLPTIVAAVLAAVAYQVFLVAVSVSLATLAESRLVRSALHFLTLGLLLLGFSTGVGVSMGLAEVARSMLASGTFWLAASSVVFSLVSTGVLLFEAAAAHLALTTEDYARGPRLAYLVQYTGLCGFYFVAARSLGDADLLLVGALCSAAYAALVGVFVSSDRDSMARAHWASGSRASLFKPGALRGFALVLCTLVISSALFLGLIVNSNRGVSEVLVVAAAPAFTLLYLSASHLLARLVPHHPTHTPAMVRLAFVGLVVVGSGLPPLIGAFFDAAGNPALNLLNPVVGLVNIGKHGLDALPLVGGVWATAVLVTGLALVSLRRRDVEPTS